MNSGVTKVARKKATKKAAKTTKVATKKQTSTALFASRAARDEVICQLVEAGVEVSALVKVLGISNQRVYQILQANKVTAHIKRRGGSKGKK